MLVKQLPNVELSYAGRLCFSSIMFWLVAKPTHLVPRERVKTFLQQTNKVVFD